MQVQENNEQHKRCTQSRPRHQVLATANNRGFSMTTSNSFSVWGLVFFPISLECKIQFLFSIDFLSIGRRMSSLTHMLGTACVSSKHRMWRVGVEGWNTAVRRVRRTPLQKHDLPTYIIGTEEKTTHKTFFLLLRVCLWICH